MSPQNPAQPQPQSQSQPCLGLVCITTSKEIRYRTVTRKRLLEHDDAGQRKVLDDIYRANLQILDGAIDYCRRHDIGLYRMPSSIFPFLDEDVGRATMEALAPALARTGARARELGLRLVMHPDQFVVLSSDSPGVVANSVKILQMHADIMDLLGQPRSPWALLEIHGGKANRSDALVARIAELPDPIRLRLGLENDEYSYSAREIHDVCARSGVPMVFDAHHHIVHEKLDSYDDPSVAEMLSLARATWPDPAWQLVHISNGREGFNDRQHADMIATMPASYAQAPWIEIEAKAKEEAIAGLRAWQHARRPREGALLSGIKLLTCSSEQAGLYKSPFLSLLSLSSVSVSFGIETLEQGGANADQTVP